jgi:hypothetical protein
MFRNNWFVASPTVGEESLVVMRRTSPVINFAIAIDMITCYVE